MYLYASKWDGDIIVGFYYFTSNSQWQDPVLFDLYKIIFKRKAKITRGPSSKITAEAVIFLLSGFKVVIQTSLLNR